MTTGSAATIDPTGMYRYELARWWAKGPQDLWIMCNPSIASAVISDPTIAKCKGFSRRWGSGGFRVVNAYAYRATKPTDLWAAHRDGTDICGPENDWRTELALRVVTGRVVVAWGAHPRPDRIERVRELIELTGRTAWCLGTTRAGAPRHPLMLPYATQLEPWGR